MTDQPLGTDPTLTPTQAIAVADTRATQAGALQGSGTGKLPDRYRITGSLGAGGMGEVLLATDGQIGRDVAIKRMLLAPSDLAVARFVREAKIQGRLDHPAIVPVHELAADGEGHPFFVMKRLAGTTLADVLAHGEAHPRFTRQKLLRAFADVCLAIELAHSKSVIHRDLKPANIMLGDFGEVYVLDWGIARVIGEVEVADPTAAGGDGELTQAGAILGTPGYIAPELIRGETVDQRADVFALGSILFELLSGTPLLPRGPSALVAVVSDFEPRPAARFPDRDIPPELDALCAEAASPDAARRPSARALAERIEQYLDGDRDLVQRNKVASAHLEAARAALAKGDGTAERATAMREAGRALALDPTSGAADLLGRLMLEPPREVPREVEVRLSELDEGAARTKAKSFLPLYIISIAFAPVLLWIGLTLQGVAIYLAAVSINAAVAYKVGCQLRANTGGDMYLAAITNALLVAMLAYLFSPALLAPSVAIVSMMMFASDPRLRLVPLLVITLGGIFVPWALEAVDVLTHSLSAVGGGLLVSAKEFSVMMPQTELTLAVCALLIVTVGGYVTKRIASSERAALRAVELQAWHLRQLVQGAEALP